MQNVKYYRVKALSVGSDSAQKIFHLGDKVSADLFPDGHVEKLVKEGFLEPWYEQKEENKEEEKSEAKDQKTDKQPDPIENVVKKAKKK